MENFRGKPLDGEWWDPSRPSDHYKGVLRLDEEHHGTLTLRGTESNLAFLENTVVPRTFFGRIENKYTYEVTLFSAELKRGPGQSFPINRNRETDAEFYTNNIFIGAYIESEKQRRFSGARLHLTGLEEWCDTTGFSGKLEHKAPGEIATETVNVSFQATTSPHYNLGGGRLLRFLSEYRGPFAFDHSKSIALAERNTIELMFSEKISIDELLAEITIWQTFITFGLRRPSYIDEVMPLIHLRGEDFITMGLIVPGRRPELSSGRRNPTDMLFNQSKLGPNIASFLRVWREKQDDIEIAVQLFSSAAYQDAAYIHINLLSYLQALEILHRESFKLDRFPDRKTRKATIDKLRAAVPAELGKTLGDEIRQQLSFIGSLTLIDRLKHLYSLYPKSLKPLFRRGDMDMVLLKDTRNYLTHYGDQRPFGRELLWSRDIFVLKEKARLFLEICLLGITGMNDDDIFALLEQFDPYRDWRMETSMDVVNEMLRSVEAANG